MTQDLRTSLEELVADGPPSLMPYELAQAAWSQGRRRHRLRQATAATVVLAVLGVGAAAVPFIHQPQRFAPADGGGSPAVEGYPQRIGHQWWVRDLPAKPGPMALLMQRVVHRDTYDQPAGWEAVSESGQRWRIPGIYGGNDDYPSLSPDGRRLAHLSGARGPYVIRDLVSGQVTTFPSVGSAVGSSETTYVTQGQAPAFWSPDGQHVVMAGFRDEPPYSGRALVLGVDGSVQLAHGRGFPAGWLDAQTVVWLAPETYRGSKPVPVDVEFTDLSGRALRSVTLATPMRPASLHGQWSSSVSPRGAEIQVIQDSTFSTVIRRFSLADGEPIGRAMSITDIVPACALAWADSTPVISVLEQGIAYPAQLTSTGAKRLIAIEPRVGSQCVVFAADALSGSRQGMPFGRSMAPWTWWWREILLAVLLTGSLVWFARRRIVVRRRRGSRQCELFDASVREDESNASTEQGSL